MRLLLVGAALLSLAVFACGSDDDDAAPSGSSAATVITASQTISSTPRASSTPSRTPTVAPEPEMQRYDVPAGTHPHDVAPAADGGVWYTAQATGYLGWLDPATGDVREIALGPSSSPHGVIVGPDGDAWVTDGGQNAIVRVDAETDEVQVFPLPEDRPNANLNTAAFDASGRIWFTGQAGIYGVLDPASGAIQVYDAPRGPGPYGIDATPDGEIYFVSLAGSYLGDVDEATGAVTVIDPPTVGAGLRRVWSDSEGVLWMAEWNAGQLASYDPATGAWREWPLPAEGGSQAYAVYVDDRDDVWLTDFTANTIVRFDPDTETFESFQSPESPANVRQLLGRPGELWGAESAQDKLVVIRY